MEVRYRDIPRVVYSAAEAQLMKQHYHSAAMNIYVFVGAEEPYIPIFLRLRPPTIHRIRKALVAALGKPEIDDGYEFKVIHNFLMKLAATGKQGLLPNEAQSVIWPMIEHNLPEIRGNAFTSVPEKNCVFMRLTITDDALLMDSIYSVFAHDSLNKRSSQEASSDDDDREPGHR